MQSIHSIFIGGMVEWLKASDCKSDDASLRRFESYSLHHNIKYKVLSPLYKNLVTK